MAEECKQCIKVFWKSKIPCLRYYVFYCQKVAALKNVAEFKRIYDGLFLKPNSNNFEQQP